MKTDVIKTKKTKLIESINKTWASSQDHSKSAIDDAIKVGGMLFELKRITPHGKWEELISNRNQEFRFGDRQARKLMQIYDNRELVKLSSNGDPVTINGSIELIKNATEEQRAEAEKIRIEEQIEADRIAAKKAMDEIDRKNKAALDKKKRAEGLAKEPEPIEGEFTEVRSEETPKYMPIVEEPAKQKTEQDELEELLDETFLNNEILLKENESIVKILNSNDKVAVAVEEAKKYRDEVAFLKTRINQLMHENNALKNACKSWQKRYEKLSELTK